MGGRFQFAQQRRGVLSGFGSVVRSADAVLVRGTDSAAKVWVSLGQVDLLLGGGEIVEGC